MSNHISHKNQGFAQIIVFILIGVLIGVIGYLVYSNQQVIEKPVNITGGQTQEGENGLDSDLENGTDEGVEDEAAYTEETGVEGQLRYVSPRLGVSFEYQEVVQLGQAVQEFVVLEDGSTIYIYDKNLPMEDGKPMGGKYVEVFDKDENLSLKQALEEEFDLVSNENCSADSLSGSVEFNPAYETAQISLVQEEAVEYSLPEMMEAVEANCPTPYTPVNGVAFFIMNPAAASKMAFLSVGQSCMPSGEEGVCWYETVQLFE